MLAGCAVERRGEEHDVAESSERVSCTAVELVSEAVQGWGCCAGWNGRSELCGERSEMAAIGSQREWEADCMGWKAIATRRLMKCGW